MPARISTIMPVCISAIMPARISAIMPARTCIRMSDHACTHSCRRSDSLCLSSNSLCLLRWKASVRTVFVGLLFIGLCVLVLVWLSIAHGVSACNVVFVGMSGKQQISVVIFALL
jgi:hypothetical protein